MLRCSYLAIDYEAEYGSKRLNMIQRIVVKRTIRQLPAQEENSSNKGKQDDYRKPWSLGKKEHVSFDVIEQRLKNLRILLHQNVNKFDRIFPNAVHRKCDSLHEFSKEHMNIPPEVICSNRRSLSLQIEDFLPMKGIRKWRPSISGLLRKHRPVVLSDPYEEIRSKYQDFQFINASMRVMKLSESNYAEFVEEFAKIDSNETAAFNVWSIEVDEDFIHDLKLIKEYHDWPGIDKIPITDVVPIQREMNELLKYEEVGISSWEKHNPTKITWMDDDISSLDLKKEDGYMTCPLEQPAIIPTSWFGKIVASDFYMELAKYAKTDNIAKDLEGLIKNRKPDVWDKEDCNAALVSRILLPEAKLDDLKLSELFQSTKLSKLPLLCCEYLKPPTGDWELARNWNITKYVESRVTNLLTPESQEVFVKNTMFTKQACEIQRCNFTIAGEIFENLEREFMIDPSICNQASCHGSLCDADCTVARCTCLADQNVNRMKYQCQQDSSAHENMMTPENPAIQCKMVQLAKQSLAFESSPNQTFPTTKSSSRLNKFLWLRGLSSPFQQSLPNGESSMPHHIGFIPHIPLKQEFLPIGIDGLKMKPTRSNCKRTKIHITGGLLKIVFELEKIIAPVLDQLRSMGALSTNSRMCSSDADMTEYLLKVATKYPTNLGSDLCRSPSHLLLITLHCFEQCKCRLLNMSARSALGFLENFYQDKKQSLESLHEKESTESTSILSMIPRAIFTLKNFITNTLFTHPKLRALMDIVTDTFSKDKKRGVESSKILVLCSTYCCYLFGEIMEAINFLNRGPLQNMLKPAALPLPAHPRFYDDAVTKAISRQCNIIVMATNLITIDFPWNTFKLALEFDTNPSDLPWEKICAESGLKHRALEMECLDCIDNEKVITLMGSIKIAKCGNLLQLLETRYNITITEDSMNCAEWSSFAMKDFKSALKFDRNMPDLILDCRTCIIVENFASLNSKNEVQFLHGIIFRLLDLQKRFTKCSVIISDVPMKISGYPLKGDFPTNLARLHAAVNNLLKKTLAFEMTIFCSFSVEHFAYLISRLVSKCQSSQTSAIQERMLLHSSAKMHECFLIQFPSINIFAAREMLASAGLKEIASKCLEDLKECFPNIPPHFLEDFYVKLHECSAPSNESDLFSEFSFDVDIETSEQDSESSDFFTRFSRNFEEPDAGGRDEKSYQMHGRCRKRLRFEKIKGWKGSQTRLTLV